MDNENTTMRAVAAFAFAGICVLIAIFILSYTLGGSDAAPEGTIPVDEVPTE